MNFTNSSYLKNYLQAVLGKYDFLTYEEIARVFSIAKQTLYNDKATGLLKPINAKARIPRFSHNELFNYLSMKQMIPLAE